MRTMAPDRKSNKGGRPASANPKKRVISFRVSEEFGAWFDGLSDHVRIPAASVVELALIKWAKDVGGYESTPPKR